MDTFRFIHTGDLHLDSPLRTLARVEDERVDRLRGASRRAFDALVDRAMAERVDAVIIAGDLWDRELKDTGAALYVAERADALAAAGIRAVAILGNHDADSPVTRQVNDLTNLHIFPSDKPASLDVGKAVVHGQSFPRRDVWDNLALDYPPAVDGRINIGILHTGLEGNFAHAKYAPCTLGDLSAKGYDYWALGHIHSRAVLQSGAASAGGTVAYCGVLQGRQVGELGLKGAYLCEASVGTPVRTAAIDFPFVVWELVDVDLTDVDTPSAAISAMVDAIDAVRSRLDAAVELCVIRVVLTGTTAVHGALPLMERALRDRASEAVGDEGRLMLERLRLATRPPRDAAAVPLPSGFADDLRTAAGDEQVAKAALAAAREVLSDLDAEVRDALARQAPHLLELSDDAAMRAQLDDAAARLTRRIASDTL